MLAWLQYVGIATLAYFALQLAKFINMYFVARPNLGKYKKAGDWAVVTGASDGIGKAMSLELARRGFNVCLISRTKSKLEEVAVKVKENNVNARTIAFDFSKADEAEYARLFKELDQLSIGVLINNVGINYEWPMGIYESDAELDLSLIKVNCESQIRMTKYVATKLKEKRAGAILNLSSASCRVATPMLAVYGATKSFNKSLSEALSVELAPFNIDVMAVTPAFVCSNMSGRSRPTFDCPSAKAMAWNTLNQLGVATLTYGHRHHGIIGAVMEVLPKSFLDGYLLKTNKVVQKKAKAKKERKAAEAAAAAKQ